MPEVADAADALFEDGHLWIQELVDGVPFRFRVRSSGLIQFGDADAVFEPGTAPLRVRHAARELREDLDREALRNIESDIESDIESIVFFGVAVEHRRIDYDWASMPSFIGTDVWQGEKGRYLSPDAVERVYEHLGLTPVNTVAKEVRARDVDPADYEIPRSNWADGPAAGLVFRDKTGHRAKLENPDLEANSADDSTPRDPSELVAEYVTDVWIDELLAGHDVEVERVDFDTLSELVVDRLIRERGHELREDIDTVDQSAFRSAVATRIEPYLHERRL